MPHSGGIGEGDHLELTERSLRPRVKGIFSHQILDEHKRKLAAAVVSRFTPKLIRAHSLANLHRWRKNGVWVSAYEEWRNILENAGDGELFAAMLGRDDYGMAFNHELAVRGLVNRAQLLDLLHKTAIDDKTRLRIQARIAGDFLRPSPEQGTE